MTPEQLAAKKKIEAMQAKVGSSFSMNSKELVLIESAEDQMDRILFAPARKICDELQANPVPAAELTHEQQQAIYLLAGFLKYENGRLKSIRPVGICDNPAGGYVVSMAPENQD
jgi:hypothetical protein